MFTDGYFPGISGVATSVQSSVRTLEERGHSTFIVAPKYPHYQDEADQAIFRLRSMPLPTKKNLRVATYVPGTSLVMASQLDLDIIHGHAGGPISMLGLEVARIKRIPYIFTYHTMFDQYTHYILKGKVIKPKAIEMVTRIFVNSTDHVIAPTEKIKDSLIECGVKKPITILPTGIDTTKYYSQPSSFLHGLTGLPADTKLLLYLGRLGKEKSIDLLIKGFAQTANKQAQADLVIVGDGPEKASLKDLAKDLGVSRRVHFTGFMDPSQTPQAYSDSYMSFLPSTTETQGLAVPESLACGTPVTVAKDKAFTYVIKHQQTGLIAPTQTPSAYAKLILWALEHPDQVADMGNRGQQIVQDYSLPTTTDKLETLYQSLLK